MALTPAPKRAEILYRAGEIIRARKEDLARAMTREMGKILIETRGDVRKASTWPTWPRAKGAACTASPRRDAQQVGDVDARAVGVVGVITPWNFPFAIPSWKLMPALVAGNTGVQAGGRHARMAWHFTKIFEEAGLPPGVLDLVFGSGSQVGDPMVAHARIR